MSEAEIFVLVVLEIETEQTKYLFFTCSLRSKLKQEIVYIHIVFTIVIGK